MPPVLNLPIRPAMYVMRDQTVPFILVVTFVEYFVESSLNLCQIRKTRVRISVALASNKKCVQYCSYSDT